MKKISYEKALEELQEIVSALRENTISIDELENKTIRAKELIQYCREKLRKTEEELGGLFE